jgi:rhodanese-related sulfurtransferase
MPIHEIDAETLKRWLDNDEVLIVDVREPGEYGVESISGTHLLPLGMITKDKLPNFLDKKLVVHCRSGKRGEQACEKLLKEDSSLELYHLKGGLLAWTAAGYATSKKGKFCMSLDRQVHITIGIGILVGVLLGYFVHSGFFLIPAFFAAGLLYAGLSGTCTLEKMLAKLPWNS